MLKISGYKISLTRGDSAYINLDISNADGSAYQMNDGDVVRVQVRDVPNTGDLMFEGIVEVINGVNVWHIYPEQTTYLEVKTYYWDAQLCTANGDVFTFIPASQFKLLDEVTMIDE